MAVDYSGGIGNLSVWQCAIVGYVSYIAISAIYNLYFHPLAKFPGPRLWAVSRMPFIAEMLGGNLPFRIKSFHDEYGSIVRVATGELSFIDSAAWKVIYSKKKFLRPKLWGSRPPGAYVSAPMAEHARFRRAFQSAFSEKATKQHEPTVNRYVDVLINRLKEATKKSGEKSAGVDLVQWINFTVFDVIGDLGWGASFHCLENQTYHPWVKFLLHFKEVLKGTSVRYYPWLDAFLMSIMPKSAFADLEKALSHAHNKVQERLS